MTDPLIDAYDPALPLERAWTPPSAWYTDEGFAGREAEAVFGRNWVVAGRVDQLQKEGDYLATEIGGQPIVLVRSSNTVRAFYNVCRHHAAEVVGPGAGCARSLRCPYHGWTYSLDGQLLGTPQFGGAEDFRKEDNGLTPVRAAVWEKWIFVCLTENAGSLETFLGKNLYGALASFQLDGLKFHARVTYELDCNWKVFVDNYLDGGYHVPVLHQGLNAALDYKDYQVTVEDRHCLQDCPTSKAASSSFDGISEVRGGERASYFWQYPNFMINLYEGVMDTNIVIPLSPARCRVHFDYYFGEDPKYTEAFKERSVEVAHGVQMEDEAICHSVQRGLASRAFDRGRLSPEKEAGEHLFHRLLHRDLKPAPDSLGYL